MPEPVLPKSSLNADVSRAEERQVVAEASPAEAMRREPGGLFAEPVAAKRRIPLWLMAIGGAVAAIALILLLTMGRHQTVPATLPTREQPVAAYAGNLPLTNLVMSESTSFSGGKETYVDGHIANTGTKTVSGVTVQVLFAPDGGGSPQLETVPVNLIRMRQPYIDTEPVSAAPLAPGASADFRLIFDDVRPEWDQQPPTIRVIGVMAQ
ncbi:MAG: DUF2393 family protein [Janthinobacterium lividum]